jgi:hypothetical protein
MLLGGHFLRECALQVDYLQPVQDNSGVTRTSGKALLVLRRACSIELVPTR